MIAIIAAVALQSATGQAAYRLYGVGSNTCASMSTAENLFPAIGWELAFWTGMKVANRMHVGDDIDWTQIAVAIQKQCNLDPTQTIALATQRVYQRFQDAGL